MAEQKRGIRKTANGVVVSVAGNKTIVVQIKHKVKHPLYGKYVHKHTKLKAHNPENLAGVGDYVSVIETRPLSKTKRWRLVEVMEKAKSLVVGPDVVKDVPKKEEVKKVVKKKVKKVEKKAVEERANVEAPAVDENKE